MQTTETLAEGLKREFKIIVPAADVEKRVESRLEEIGKTAKIPGFRPGHIPMNVLQQRYGTAVIGEALQQTVSETSLAALEEKGYRPAVQPSVEITAYEPGKDLEYTMKVEILPKVEPTDVSKIELERLVAEPREEEVEKALERLAASRRTTQKVEDARASKKGDVIVIDFAGTVDGKALPGMKADGHYLELGSHSFVDTFEDQLEGTKVGDHRTVKVTFPKDYGHKDLAGKDAVFEVDVKEIREIVTAKADDELAKSFGQENLEELKKAIRESVGRDYKRVSRLRLKRALLDKLAETNSFEVPQGMLDMEFDAIWRQVQHEKEHGHLSEAEMKKSEDELKADYKAIAERRVRLGLLLSEIGVRAKLEVTDDELGRGIVAEARRYPGQAQQILEYYRKNPQAANSIKASIFEEKVVDYVLELAKVSEKSVQPSELLEGWSDEDEE